MSHEEDELRYKIRNLSKKCAFLFAVLFIYLIAGAALFHFLEYGEREEEVEDAIDDLESDRAELLRVLWGETIAKGEQDWAAVANDKLDMYEKKLKKYFKDGIDLQEDDDDDDDDEEEDDEDDDNPWSLSGSLFYCFTVVTTIGYGNLSPDSDAGKIATIIYALIGIPLTLNFIAEMGKLLALCLKFAVVNDPMRGGDTSEEFNYTVPSALAITGVYLFAGALVFYCIEDDWSLLDATYFGFITFSTIGFGDLVPSELELNLLLIIYVLSAMSLVSMCFCVLQAALSARLEQLEVEVSTFFAAMTHRGKSGVKNGPSHSYHDE